MARQQMNEELWHTMCTHRYVQWSITLSYIVFRKIDGIKDCHVNLCKPDPQRQILSIFSLMFNVSISKMKKKAMKMK